ncbi:hypothetical protein BC628DRAFT_222043 [Trametes gibbosa]|nr:hypothetical protein BC628DRAFT_222043 [Trametes gibbosa]
MRVHANRDKRKWDAPSASSSVHGRWRGVLGCSSLRAGRRPARGLWLVNKHVQTLPGIALSTPQPWRRSRALPSTAIASFKRWLPLRAAGSALLGRRRMSRTLDTNGSEPANLQVPYDILDQVQAGRLVVYSHALVGLSLCAPDAEGRELVMDALLASCNMSSDAQQTSRIFVTPRRPCE